MPKLGSLPHGSVVSAPEFRKGNLEPATKDCPEVAFEQDPDKKLHPKYKEGEATLGKTKYGIPVGKEQAEDNSQSLENDAPPPALTSIEDDEDSQSDDSFQDNGSGYGGMNHVRVFHPKVRRPKYPIPLPRPTFGIIESPEMMIPNFSWPLHQKDEASAKTPRRRT